MTFQVELSKCRWTTQGIDPTHIFPNPSMPVNEGPILVSLMNDQNYFVHDGRHRCIRGLLRQDELIEAKWLEDHDAEVEAAKVREALSRSAVSKPVVLHTQARESYDSYIDRSDLPPYDMVVLGDGAAAKRGYTWKATCGRDHVHEAHYCGEHMEEHCDGNPKWIR
jgi:hypothetical protein